MPHQRFQRPGFDSVCEGKQLVATERISGRILIEGHPGKQGQVNWPQRYNLTLYHTVQSFNDPEKEAFGKHCRKKRKCR